MILLLFVFPLLLSLSTATSLNPKPRQVITTSDGFRFGGNAGQTSDESDHFKLLAADGDSLLVGARNTVYNLSLSNLGVHHKIDWKPTADLIQECIMKGKSVGDCQNYIRVLARESPGRMLICGTYAFSPKCRQYEYGAREDAPVMKQQFDGTAISPYDPRDNSTAVYLAETNEIYTGTVSDFVGNDPLIFRKRLGGGREGLRTQPDDTRVLDAPNFVGSFSYREHVYFFFRERAAEAVDNNEEKQVYARVSRVCKKDKGGARPSNEKWTSFLKARLNCSLPGNSPFYFNELQAISTLVPTGKDDLIYGVFTTPDSELRMSAVCAFSMKRIRDEFDNGIFKQQRSSQSLWAPSLRADIPRPRPGACAPDSTKLPEATVSFAIRNPLMHRAIESVFPPMLIQATDRPLLSQISVIPQVVAVSGQKFDVIYLGTADGKVLKVIDIEERNGRTSAVIEEITVFVKGAPVVNLLTTPSQLVVVSSDEIASLNVQHCSVRKQCSACVALQDPHCAWDLNEARCVSKSSWSGGGDFVQNIISGQSEQCPEGIDSNDAFEEMEILSAGDRSVHSNILTNVLVAAFAIVLTIPLTVCITVSILKSRYAADAHRSASSTSGSDYDSVGGKARLTRHDSLTTNGRMDHVYGNHPKQSIDATSYIMPPMSQQMPMSQHGSGFTTPSRDPKNITAINQNTLPRDYKVKKVYL